MGWVQQISLRLDDFGDKAVAPPGNPKIWEIFEKTVGPFACFRSQEILLHSESNSRPKFDEAGWTRLLAFKGMSTVRVQNELTLPVLQVRRKGTDSDPLISLLRELLPAMGIEADFEISLVRQVSIQIKNAGVAPEAVATALKALLSLGVRSGIYDPESEEARTVLAGPAMPWRDRNHDQDLERLRDKFLLANEQGSWSPLRRTYRLQEFKPRARNPEAERVINANSLLRRDENHRRVSMSSHLSPLNFIVSLPRKPDSYSDLQKFRYRLESLSALFDRSPGMVHFRGASSGPLVLDALSPLPLNRRLFSSAPFEKDTRLFFIGPWDSRNAVTERRIECWWNSVHHEATLRGEFIDGEQDWVSYLVSLISKEPGEWAFDQVALAKLVQAGDNRHRYHRVGLVAFRNNPENILKTGRTFGVPIMQLASLRDGDGVVVEAANQKVFSISRSEIMASNDERDRTFDVRWDYPETKSPTYGYERVSLHPDEFMRKVSFRNTSEREWSAQARLISNGVRFRSSTLRGVECAPFPAYRWTDGERLWAEAFGHREGWLEVDPRQAGVAAFDSALRHLISLGAAPKSGVGEIWFSLPYAASKEEENRRAAAFLLAIEGVVEAAKAFDFRIETTQIQRSQESGEQGELFLNIRSQLPKDSPVVVPGFRMNGEALFMVGPRPAFMDAGSRILKHVTRVISNHITKLSLETQLELYELINEQLQKGIVTSIRPIGEGGVASTMAEMSLWGGIGIQLRPSLSAIELFSGAPGRLVVGVLPQEAKAFELQLKVELCTALGSTGGEKILGLPLSTLRDERIRDDRSKDKK